MHDPDGNALAIDKLAAGDDGPFMTAKIATASFYGDHILSKGPPGVRDSIFDGTEGTLAMPAECY